MATAAGGAPANGVAEPLSGAQRYMFGVLAMVYACHLIDRTIILVMLEPIKREFALNDSQLGLLSGLAFAVGTVLAAMPLGTLADRRSRKGLLALCIAVWSLATLLAGLVGGFVSLLVLRFAVGAAEAGLQPTAMSLVADSTAPAQRPRAYAILHIGIPVGMMIGFVLGGWAAANIGWRSALLVVGGPGLLLALLVALTLREPARHGEEQAAQRQITLGAFFGAVWRHKPLLHVVSALILMWLGTSGGTAWLSSFLIRSHGLSLTVVGVLMATTAGLGGILGNVLAGTVVQRFAAGRRDRLALCAAGGALLYFPVSMMLFLAPSLPLVIAGMALQPVCYFLAYTPGYALTMDLADAKIRARTAALVSMGATAIGYGLGPQIVGILSDLFTPIFGGEALRYAVAAMMLAMLWSATHFLVARARLLAEPGA